MAIAVLRIPDSSKWIVFNSVLNSTPKVIAPQITQIAEKNVQKHIFRKIVEEKIIFLKIERVDRFFDTKIQGEILR